MLRIASACTSVSVNALDQLGLGLVLVADDADHLVEVEVGDQVAVEDVQPVLDLVQAERERRTSTSMAVLEPLRCSTSRSAMHARASARADSTFMLSGEADLEFGQPGTGSPSAPRLDGAALGLEHEADILGALVADVAEQRQLLVLMSSASFSTSLAFCTW